MLADVKKTIGKRGFTSISEFFRDAARHSLYPHVTENGFTPEFEQQVLEAAKEPIEDSIEWDGKTPFTEFVLRQKFKSNGKNKIHRKISKRSK